MDHDEMEPGLRNLDHRVGLVEQILPTLTTKDDLEASIAPLATKAELQATIEPLTTKADLRAAVSESEGRTRTHFDVGFESLRDDIRLIADGLAMLTQKVDQNHSALKTDIAGGDHRLMRIEAAQSRS